MKTLELRRSAAAETAAKGANKDLQNFIDDFPLRVANCGLVNALEFLREKAKPPKDKAETEPNKAARVLRTVVLNWLEKNATASDTKASLREATEEAQAFGMWLKRQAKLQAEAPRGQAPQQRPDNDPYFRQLRDKDQSAYDLIEKRRDNTWHGGLLFDKLTPPNEQKDQKELIERTAACAGDQKLLDRALARHKKLPGISTLRATLVSPLAAHLARTAALENAALCLHPLYGFAYLPGSGVKGMARAYAETVWLPAQNDQAAAWGTIKTIFGWAPGDDLLTHKDSEPSRKTWITVPDDKGYKDKYKDSHAGAIVFHDALPETWPELAVDIAAVHHGEYYKGKEAPGDWDTPNLVTFLTAKPGHTFQFPISTALPSATKEHIKTARLFIAGALTCLGAGAKTAAGYGAFRVENVEVDLSAIVQPETYAAELALVTPAYLAGANQENPASCELRVPSLRGQLRWWWRTLHAGHLGEAQLRQLEGAIWGTTETSSPIRLTLVETTPKQRAIKSPFMQPKGKRLYLSGTFAKDHGIEEAPAMTTQPLYYMTYGVDVYNTKKTERTPYRYCIFPGTTWALQASVRKTTLDNRTISAEMVLQQFKSALWLLCHFGGVGTRSRRGTGSIDWRNAEDFDVEKLQAMASSLRSAAGLKDGKGCGSPALPKQPLMVEQKTTWTDAWQALDRLGAVYQSFCQAPASTGYGKHCEAKGALGLPRQIHGPRKEALKGQNPANHKEPVTLVWEGRRQEKPRFPSPVHFHLSLGKDGKYIVRMIIVPSEDMPMKATSSVLFQALHKHVEAGLASAATIARAGAGNAAGGGLRRYENGSEVEVEILKTTTKKGGLKAKVIGEVYEGSFSDEVNAPEEAAVGSKHTVTIKSAGDDALNWFFYWAPPPKKENKKPQGKGNNQARRR